MEQKKQNRREGGFTLIELISVIIILGILAAVVVPKYFDMTSKAQSAAYKGAMSEGMARFNMAYAQYIMNTNTVPTDITGVLATPSYLGTGAETDTGVSIGDYNMQYVKSATELQVTLRSKGGATVLSTMTTAWPNSN